MFLESLKFRCIGIYIKFSGKGTNFFFRNYDKINLLASIKYQKVAHFLLVLSFSLAPRVSSFVDGVSDALVHFEITYPVSERLIDNRFKSFSAKQNRNARQVPAADPHNASTPLPSTTHLPAPNIH